MKESKNLVVLPVRGGSKGIKKKNIFKLNKKPLLGYVIDQLVKLENNFVLAVTSDDKNILDKVKINKKIEIIKINRPENLSGDKTTLDPVIYHAFEYCEKVLQTKFSNIITVQATSPLLNYKDIKNALQMFNVKKYDSLLTVIEDTHLRWRLNGNKYIPLFKKRVNRQKLEKDFRETGSFQICSRKQILKKERLGKKIYFYEILPKVRGLDIDTLHDMYIAELVLKHKNKFLS